MPRSRFLVPVYAAAVIALAYLFLSAARDDQAATTVFVGATVLTIDGEFSEAQAIAVRGDKIVAVGSRETVIAEAGAEAEVVDMTGKTILPAFIDAHSHIVAGGQSTLFESVGQQEFATVDEALAHMTRAAASAKEGDYLLFRNVDLATQPFADDVLTLEHLDRVADTVPLIVWHAGGHVASVNSQMLEVAGITKETKDPAGGGSYGRYPDGRPNGVLFGATILGALQRIPAVRGYDFLGGAVAVSKAMVAQGMGTAGIAGIGSATGVGDWQIYKQLGASPEFALRTRIYLQANQAAAWDEAKIAPGMGDASARIIGWKISADGSNQARTGLQREPYLGTDRRGQAYMTHVAVKGAVREFSSRGHQLAMHGNGDAAIDRILDAVASAREEGIEVVRPRIEHCSIVQDDQLERFVELGVSGSFLIAHVRYWGKAFRDDVFGPEKAALLDRCASFESSGIPFSLHTDFAVSEISPLEMVEISVTRSLFADPSEVLAPDERASIEAALRGVTSVPAWQLQSESEIGSLEVGKFADFVVLDQDPRAVPVDAIDEIQVLETWVGGRRVWSRP